MPYHLQICEYREPTINEIMKNMIIQNISSSLRPKDGIYGGLT